MMMQCKMHCKMSTGLAAQLQRPPRQRATNPWSRCCCICICICILQGLHPPPALTCPDLPCPASPRLSAQQPGVFDQISMGISEMGIDTEMRMEGMGWLTEISKGCIGATLRCTHPSRSRQGQARPNPVNSWTLFSFVPHRLFRANTWAGVTFAQRIWHTCQMVAVAEAPTSRTGGNLKLDSPMTTPGRVD